MNFLRRIPRWLPAVALFATVYFLFDAAVLFFELRLGGRRSHEIEQDLRSFHLGVLKVSLLVYALFRAFIRHPIFLGGYRKWLRTTPWHAGMPLPLGDVTLNWRDGIVLFSALALAHWHAHVAITGPVLAFAIPYACAILLCLMATDQETETYIIAMGMALVVRMLPAPIYAAALAVLLCAVTQVGLRRSLKRFPWDRSGKADPAVSGEGHLSVVIPNDFRPMVTARGGGGFAVLAGVWVWSLCSLGGFRLPPDAGAMLLGMIAFCLAAFRVLIYCGKYHPPTNVFGRLRSGRIVLPGYDKVFVAPVLVICLAVVTPLALGRLGIPPAVWAGATAAAVFALLLCAGPNLRVWQLTGFHRVITAHGARKRVAA